MLLHAILSRSISERISGDLDGPKRCWVQIRCRSNVARRRSLAREQLVLIYCHHPKIQGQTHTHIYREHIEHQMAGRAAAKLCPALACALRREVDDAERESGDAFDFSFWKLELGRWKKKRLLGQITNHFHFLNSVWTRQKVRSHWGYAWKTGCTARNREHSAPSAKATKLMTSRHFFLLLHYLAIASFLEGNEQYVAVHDAPCCHDCGL